MFDMSWGEVLVIGAVALIVIGPKDLPKALRTVGKMTAQVRKMAAEFQGQFNEAMREAELEEIKKTVSGLNDQVSAVGSEVASLNTAFDPLSGATPPSTNSISAQTPESSDPPEALPARPAEPILPPAAVPLPGEPAFDLALPGAPAEPAPAEPRSAESHKA